MSIFLESGTIVACVAPEEVSVPTRKHAIRRGLPSSHVAVVKLKFVAPLCRFSTVLDVESHVLEILRTLYTRADSETLSDC